MNITTEQQKYQSDNFYPANLPSRKIFCHEQKIRARFKQELSNGIVERLRQSENKTALACAMRLERCASPQNLFVADDRHNADGEAYSATEKGILWRDALNNQYCNYANHFQKENQSKWNINSKRINSRRTDLS